MTKDNQQSKINTGKAQARSIINQAQRQAHTRKEIYIKIRDILEALPAKPKKVRLTVKSYARGYLEATTHHHLRFLYIYNDNFYCTGTGKDTGYPLWDTLPREVWANSEWSRVGGMFWIRPGMEPVLYDPPRS